MPIRKGAEIVEPKGRLGVLLVGLGAVSTTFIAGVEAIRKSIAEPIGSLTQMGTIRLGKRTDNRVPLIRDFVPLAKLEDLVFGAWDIFPDSAYEAAMHAGVLEKELLAQIKAPLQKIKPMKAVFDQSYVKRLHGTNVKEGKNKMELAQQLIAEIVDWKKKNRCSRVVMIWAASTEVFIKQHAVHKTLESFEQALRENHRAIAPSMVYAYAALKSGIPFANGAPNLTVHIPALRMLADILQPEVYPTLYKDFSHVVRINYYPPRGDNKEGWDNIDIFGWLGYKMQIKIDFLCRDSILAAPIVLDLALFLDLAHRSEMKGIQEWLSFYFKSPQTAPGLYPEHDVFIQLMKLKNTLRHLRGEDLITHLGLEYYD